MKKALFALMIALVLAVVCNQLVQKEQMAKDALLNILNCVLSHVGARHRIACSSKNQQQCLLWRSNGGFILQEKTRERNKLDELSCRNIINRTATVRIKT